MTGMKNEVRRTNTTVSAVTYHFVFLPRYRRKVLVGTVAERLRELLEEACAEVECKIVALEIMPDHVHLFVSALPQWSPSAIMGQVKGKTSRILRQEFPALARMTSLWTRSFYVGSTGAVSTETVRRYIEAQKTRG